MDGGDAFEARVRERLLRRPANPDEALVAARLAGVPIMYAAVYSPRSATTGSTFAALRAGR